MTGPAEPREAERAGSEGGSAGRPRVLVLAGLDPSGGAGLLADAEAIRAGGGRPLVCATAITVQTTRAVRRFEALPISLVIEQATALLEEDGPVAAVKLGMLGSPEIAEAVARLAARPQLAKVPWVIDPVLRSSSGAGLGAAARAYDPLLPLGAVWTPNVPEAAALAGRPAAEDEGALREQAGALLALGPRAVIAKGGHLPGEPADLVVEAAGTTRLPGVRRPGTRRGTGCRFASAVATALARGASVPEAARVAKAYVARYLDVG